MRLAVIVCFLDEEAYLGELLASLGAQERPPAELLLVDDGSRDGSAAAARAFAQRHPYARVLRRPRRGREADRLATAAEHVAFTWAVQQLEGDWDVVAKLDADLRLPADTLAELERRLAADPGLGIVGAHLSVEGPGGAARRERCPPGHVRGATKFYRRACYEQIAPVPSILGWDTIDEVSARLHGWRTETVAVPSGDVVHLRPTSTQDGRLRGLRRLGAAAYGYGAHPLWVLGGAASRVGEPPPVLGALAYVAGYARAAVRRVPRAGPGPRAQLRAEHRRRVVAALRARCAALRRRDRPRPR
jgi:glycosyltransferase involved in cell wall biosynthesis